ncbi:MAG: radical SAM protein [Candidatus Lokiarchaeota archaeon]|nr:radical SAM protein [Candidatus Lokiarchaeota archaeon]
MNILLLNPSGRSPTLGLDDFIKAPPLGLMSLAGIPDPDKHKVKIIDLKYKNWSQNKLKKVFEKSDIIGITCLTPSVNHTIELTRLAKQTNPKATTMVGGYHPTLDPNMIEEKSIDIIIKSEGEDTFKELIEGEKPLKDIKGISFSRDDGTVHHNELRPLIEDLDELPFPDRTITKKNFYSYFGLSVDNLESARGCPHSCYFCCVTVHNRRRWRAKSPQRVIEEIEQMNRGRRWYTFCDSSFTIRMDRVKEICDLIIEHGLSYKYYSAQGRVDDIVKHPKIVDRMAEAGFKMLFIGIESVKQASLDKIGKRTTIEQNKEAIESLHDHGITIFGSMIIGNVGETIEDVKRDIEFCEKMDIDIMQFTPLTPYPGTKLYEEALEKDWIKNFDWEDWNLVDPIMRTPDLSIKEIKELVTYAYKTFYLKSIFNRNSWVWRGARRISMSPLSWFWREVPSFLVSSIPAIFKFARRLDKMKTSFK